MIENTDNYSVLMAKKAEKLVTAIYLVSDLIVDEDPLKSAIRTNAISLLSSMNTFFLSWH